MRPNHLAIVPQSDVPTDPAAFTIIKCLDDIRPAAEELHAAAKVRGLRVAACADIASKDQIVCADGGIVNAEIFGWQADGERWWENTRLALSSPLPRACRYESEPFWCNEQGFHTRWRNRYLEDIDMTDFTKISLSRAAIVIPVHLAFGQIGAVSYSSIDREKTDLSAEFEAYAEFLTTITRRFIAGYVAVRRAQKWMPSDCKLSKREVECLRWAAIGKTDKEVSLILGLSHATVRYHIQRAAEKLNAVNRSQTIFKAGQLGYLGAAA